MAATVLGVAVGVLLAGVAVGARRDVADHPAGRLRDETDRLREELHAQQVRYLEGRIERARLPERLALETYPWDRQPAAPKAQILQLATLDFLADGTLPCADTPRPAAG